MLEFFFVSHLMSSTGEMAAKRGLSVKRWKIYAALCWIVFEILGIIISLYLFGELNIPGLLIAYVLPALAHFLLRWQLGKYPDVTIWLHEVGTESQELLMLIRE